MRQLGRPTLLCHRLVVDGEGFVADYKLRQPNPKRHAVNALKGLNYQVIAAGDSFNDTGMLGAADAGFFIHPPETASPNSRSTRCTAGTTRCWPRSTTPQPGCARRAEAGAGAVFFAAPFLGAAFFGAAAFLAVVFTAFLAVLGRRDSPHSTNFVPGGIHGVPSVAGGRPFTTALLRPGQHGHVSLANSMNTSCRGGPWASKRHRACSCRSRRCSSPGPRAMPRVSLVLPLDAHAAVAGVHRSGNCILNAGL